MTRRRLAHILKGIAARPMHAVALMVCAGTAVLAAALLQGLAGGVGRQVDALIADWRNQRLIAAYGRRATSPDGRLCEVNSLTDGDLQALTGALGARAAFYPRLIATALVEAGGTHRQMDVRAYSTDYFRLAQWYTASGEPLTAEDDVHSEKVCVVGAATAAQFFGDANAATGKLLRINSVPFRVKGVLERRGRNIAGEELDAILFIPVSTARKRTFCVDGFRGIGYVIHRPADDDSVTGSIVSILRSRHGIPSGGDEDFRIVDPNALRRMHASAFRTKERMILLITVVAAFLGMGVITNVTLLAVQQRRAEIGLKRAIGATRADVIAEIVWETTVIAIGGAVLGLVLFALAWAVIPRWTRTTSELSSFPLAFSWLTAVTSAAAAIVIGGLAAILPSRAAARVDPAEALRP